MGAGRADMLPPPLDKVLFVARRHASKIAASQEI